MSLTEAPQLDVIQYIDPNSQAISALPNFATPDLLIDLYTHMLRTRLFDAKAVALQRTGKLGTFPSSLGQEAIAVATGHAMASDDILCPYYRDQGAMLLRGVKMEELFAYWGGDERGSQYANVPHDFPIAVPIASQCLHATGCAYAIAYRQEKRAVVASIGDGGTSKGDFYEAMNLAGVWNLPVVFVVNNNRWAISVPLSAQTHCQTLAQKAIAAGFQGIRVDGNDAVAVRDVVATALAKAKNGGGPTLIEAMTYRLCDHTTADDAKRYVDPSLISSAWPLEPIKRLYDYLVQQQMWTPEQNEALTVSLSNEIEQSVANYLAMPPQPASAILDYQYEVWPENLRDQADQLGECDYA